MSRLAIAKWPPSRLRLGSPARRAPTAADQRAERLRERARAALQGSVPAARVCARGACCRV
eukprot:3115918-Rhodomonas_salina.1